MQLELLFSWRISFIYPIPRISSFRLSDFYGLRSYVALNEDEAAAGSEVSYSPGDAEEDNTVAGGGRCS